MNLFVRSSQAICRAAPYAIFNWRFFVPKQSTSIYLHKYVFKTTFNNHLKIIWPFIILYNYGIWLGLFGCLRTWKCWKKNSSTLSMYFAISRSRQLFDLLKLTYSLTIPPHFYYLYKLYNYSSNDWLSFIYTHELLAWHRAMSPKISQSTQMLLSNKALFATEMKKHGLPSINGNVIAQSTHINRELLFQKISVFIKPLCGSQKIDAYALKYEASTNTYELAVSNNKVITDEEQILDFVQNLVNKKDFVVQPLLTNHPSLKMIYSDKLLITIRLITIWAGGKTEAISAILEIPVNPYENRVHALPINIENGEILPLAENVFTIRKETTSKVKHIYGHRLIYWDELVNVAIKAHSLLPDIFSIGWDLAITPDGVKLIEGNINWGVAQHQLNGPTLMPYFIKYAEPNLKQTK